MSASNRQPFRAPTAAGGRSSDWPTVENLPEYALVHLAVFYRSVTSRVDNALAACGLRMRTYALLTVVCTRRKVINQRSAAEFLCLDPSQIVALTDELESAGLVVRAIDGNDRRQRTILPTEPGLEVHSRARDIMRALTLEVFAPGTLAEIDTLGSVLASAAQERIGSDGSVPYGRP